ncbi:hypothetical protein V2S66_12400 [Streptomyces sp. V4-01]|uniref:Uncharacterized protein n=1 Tax=Actinacidiphila polyblastidii TaxID=3110430 RepID=A0ABU7PCE5_9ACTN|nr:hypothetical protein [Streptomyces sp. V4-01]
MSSDQVEGEETVAATADQVRAALLAEERPLDVWSRCAPIRLAGYEDDPTETHILRGID